jgi:hypothetical protein
MPIPSDGTTSSHNIKDGDAIRFLSEFESNAIKSQGDPRPYNERRKKNNAEVTAFQPLSFMMKHGHGNHIRLIALKWDGLGFGFPGPALRVISCPICNTCVAN